jgi:hypothetical protein
MNMPYAVLVFYRFDLEARQVEGDRLDVIALLVTSTSHQSTHPALPALAHKVRKNHQIESRPLQKNLNDRNRDIWFLQWQIE